MNPIDSNRIGIVIWGCKGGKTTFCDNGVVDIKRTDIANTLKDIRSFIRIHRIRIDYYALEFTTEYKVYTIYRSSTDSGSGAFIAITVYVPHDMKVKHMREILKEMMDGFFRSYINALSGSPLAEGFYDIGKFNFVLRQQHQQDIVADATRYMKRASLQDDKPCVWVYNEDSELDKFFDMPYYPRFYDCQEVMFISSEIYNNQEQYEVKFLFTPEPIKDPGRPEGEGRLMRFNLPDYTLVTLLINDNAMNVDDEEIVVNLGDEIEFTITHPYYKDWTYGKPNKANLQQALDNMVFKRGDDNVYHWNTSGIAKVMMKAPKEFFLPLSIQGEGFKAKDVVQQLKLKGEDLIPVTERDGQRGFVIMGENWNRSQTLRLYPYAKDTHHFIEVESGIKPEAKAGSGLNVMLQFRGYSLSEGSAQPREVNVTITHQNRRCELKIPSTDMQLTIPAGAQVEFKANNYNCSIEGDVLKFVPAIATPSTRSSDNGAQEVGTTQQPPLRGVETRQEGSQPSSEQNEVRQTSSERKQANYIVEVVNCEQFIKTKDWKLSVRNVYSRTINDPVLYLVDKNKKVVCTVDMNNPEEHTEENSKNGFTVTVNGNKCTIVYTAYVVEVVNCERFIESGSEKEIWTLMSNENNIIYRRKPEFTNSYFSLRDSKGKVVCRVDMDNLDKYDEENRKNGFTVSFDQQSKYCRVVYEPSLFKRLGKRFMMACGLLSLLLIAGLGFWAFKHFAGKPSFEEQKYNEISALFDNMGKEASDTAKLMALIDSCAIYGIDEKGEYTDNNDSFNDLAYEVVQKLKEDTANRAAALYLLYMREKDPKVTSGGVNISALYRFTDKPAFKSDKYVEEVKNIILNNPASQADTADFNEVADGSQVTTQNNNAVDPEAEAKAKADAEAKAKADAEAKAKADAEAKAKAKAEAATNDNAQKAQQLKNFKALYDGLSKKKQISKKVAQDVRNAYNKLDKEQRKQFDVKKIVAYEALANVTKATHIHKALRDYDKYYSDDQKTALGKIDGDNYGALVQSRGYIDIDYINQNTKK